MGREATCTCEWNGKKCTVKALVEPPELILRGELRQRVPIAKMQSIKAECDQLRFTVDGDSVALSLGVDLAAKWADALLKPPPTLAKKLGITAETTVWMIGPVDDVALKAALDKAKSISQRQGDLILARVDTPRRCAIGPDARGRSTRSRHADLVHLSQGTGAPAERKSRPDDRSRCRHCRHEGGVCV
jgi:hypothetical protein